MSSTSSRTHSRSLVRSLSATAVFMRRQLWIWPIVAAVVLAVIGWFLRLSIEAAMKESMAGNLQTILNADVAALKIWLKDEEQYTQTVAADPEIRKCVDELMKLAARPETTDVMLAGSQEMSQLKAVLQPWIDARVYAAFTLIDKTGRILAAKNSVLIGKSDIKMPAGMLAAVFPTDPGKKPRPFVTRPFRSAILLEDKSGQLKAGVPTMFVIAPIIKDGKPIAALGFRIRPEDDFTRILSIARAGESGETYAFDKEGLLISQSRFDDDLKAIGLLRDRDDEHSILNIQIRDPQVNMVEGERPGLRLAQRPLTRMAAAATQGRTGFDVDGYNDYRGVPVIGAWTWLPEYGFGVTTEVDVSEAYRPLYILRYAFWGLFALLGASAVVIFVFSVVVSKLNRKARLAALEAKQLGQYTLEEEIGRGGMGIVYRGHHAMLRRPTAVKLLHAEKTTAGTIARFEREVRLTSLLSHPNTITIYDYGRTPEGIFYYAMEFLDGIDIDDLVKKFGPQPEGRVIHILEQVCGSLNEAHSAGLIHRDIKPANIFLTQRAGMADVVKVLDFGLVKALDSEKEVALTAADSLTGTPLYVSPEGIERPDAVDARSDLYALGAVGYFLLTGRPVFDGKSVVEICMQQVNATPVLPSKRLGKPVSADLESLIIQCLEKDPQQRPQSARDLKSALRACSGSQDWSEEQAHEWWNERNATDASTQTSNVEPTESSHLHDATIIADSPAADG